jgi:AcrR family transcriptional regulator
MSEPLRERGKRQRRERILESAREILRESDGGALTIDAVAHRADVSVQTIFNLIGTREVVWAALADSLIAELELGSIPQGGDPADEALAVVDALVGGLLQDAPILNGLLSNWSRSARVVDHDPARQLTDCFERLHELDADGVPLPAHRLAELLIASVIGVLHQWAAGMLDQDDARLRARECALLHIYAAAPSRAAAHLPGR